MNGWQQLGRSFELANVGYVGECVKTMLIADFSTVG